MPVHGGYVERFTTWVVPDSGFMRWFERGGAAIVEPRCNIQVPLGGPTKVAKLANVCPALRGILYGEALEEACHVVPIAAVTASGMTPACGYIGLWRLLQIWA
jgi:hypothetical protein